MLNELIADLAILLSESNGHDLRCGTFQLEADNMAISVSTDGNEAKIVKVKDIRSMRYLKHPDHFNEKLFLEIFLKLLNNRRRELQMEEKEMIDREENEKNAASGHYDAYAAGATMANF